MEVTISPKFQIVIPKDIRTRLGLRPGQHMRALAVDDSVVFVPIVAVEDLEGRFPGLETDVVREADRP